MNKILTICLLSLLLIFNFTSCEISISNDNVDVKNNLEKNVKIDEEKVIDDNKVADEEKVIDDKLTDEESSTDDKVVNEKNTNNEKNVVDKEEIEKPENKDSEINEKTYEVVRVIDGDTFIIKYNGEERRVRLLGVDTPESVHPKKEKNVPEGKIASDYTKELLKNKKVSIEFDVEEEDRYGRLLCYVYIDGEMLNKKLLEKGYAKVMIVGKNRKFAKEFREIEKNAKENKIGFWDKDVFESK